MRTFQKPLILVILVIIILGIASLNRRTSQVLPEFKTQESIKTTPPKAFDDLDQYISYTVPEGWRSEKNIQGISGIFIYSPDFAYNLATNEDSGLRVLISRRKIEDNQSGKEEIANLYSGYKDISSQINNYLIAGIPGYVFPYYNDLYVDLNYPSYAVIKDEYLWTFDIIAISGSDYQAQVKQFIDSVKFK